MKRWCGVLALLLAAIALSACATPLKSQKPPEKWSTGFWLWGASGQPQPSAETLDVLYVQVNSRAETWNQPSWSTYGELPGELPAAREYWVVFRLESASALDAAYAPSLAKAVARLTDEGDQRHITITGVQLDVDSATRLLPKYAEYLAALRKALPAPTQISITGLLDWFRDGTAIASVIEQVDEFVPQFYDVTSDYRRATAIAAKFDAATWAPKFNRFGKRYRIGISTFGRAVFVPAGAPRTLFGDLTPMDVATRPGITAQAIRNAAGEIVVSYTATRNLTIEYNDVHPGDTFQFILATPEAVRAATNAARKMGGFAAGVVFFRWPGTSETLVMPPDEVLRAAGVLKSSAVLPSIETLDGHCVAVKCVDLFLTHADRYASARIAYGIHSSAALEYFLPDQHAPIRLLGPSDLEVSIPAYAAPASLFLGRAVSDAPVHFTVEARP
ncbi:MAG: DUF3142 domain-containing protein [Acidobacteriota bacterium]